MLQDVIWLFPLAVVILIPNLRGGRLVPAHPALRDESLLYTIVLGASAGVLLMMAVWVFLQEGLVPRLVLADLLAGAGGAGGRGAVAVAPLFAPALSVGRPPDASDHLRRGRGRRPTGQRPALQRRYSSRSSSWTTTHGFGAAWCDGIKVQAPVKLPRFDSHPTKPGSSCWRCLDPAPPPAGYPGVPGWIAGAGHGFAHPGGTDQRRPAHRTKCARSTSRDFSAATRPANDALFGRG